jgi:uncharacterized membrane protein HdeD (DUF308 family)
MTSTQAKALAAVFAVLGILAVVAGVIYYVEPVKSLPSFFPGANDNYSFHRKHRGLAGIVVGAVLLVAAFACMFTARRGTADREPTY